MSETRNQGSQIRNLRFLFAAVVLTAAAGCQRGNMEYMTPERLDRGLVVILPGIEGEGRFTHDIRRGLLRAGVDSGMMIYHWGRPIPGFGPLLNQMDVIGNRLAGERIAEFIVTYQDAHRDRPVHVIGHSGGGGVAVFAAEAMPEGRSLDGLVLLSASISRGHDLSKALAHCRKGAVNFYSGGDVALLGLATTVLGNVDGVRQPSAGLVGFDKKPQGLYQVPWSEDMRHAGNSGRHDGATKPRFVSEYVAPWVQYPWPPRMIGFGG